MTIAEASRQHQLALEHHRSQDDEDSLMELEQARAVLNALWLRHVTR